MVEPQNQPIFREVQRWRPAVRLLFALLVLAADAGVIAACLATRRSPSDTVPLLFAIGVTGVLSLGGVVLLWINRLEIEVWPDDISVRFFPFHLDWRRFPAQELRECYARRYRPIREYGGWGIRYGWSGRAYNVSGHEGVQLVFKDGRKLLLGSQHPQELEAAIRSIMKGDVAESPQG